MESGPSRVTPGGSACPVDISSHGAAQRSGGPGTNTGRVGLGLKAGLAGGRCEGPTQAQEHSTHTPTQLVVLQPAARDPCASQPMRRCTGVPSRHSPAPHLLSAHEALLLPEVHVVDGEALLGPGLEGHRPVGPGHHAALPAGHLWPWWGRGDRLSAAVVAQGLVPVGLSFPVPPPGTLGLLGVCGRGLPGPGLLPGSGAHGAISRNGNCHLPKFFYGNPAA